MEETNTQIAWPSKLKIGAKSKKGKLSETRMFVVLIMDTTQNYCLSGKIHMNSSSVYLSTSHIEVDREMAVIRISYTPFHQTVEASRH